jgi:hypothetical protein
VHVKQLFDVHKRCSTSSARCLPRMPSVTATIPHAPGQPAPARRPRRTSRGPGELIARRLPRPLRNALLFLVVSDALISYRLIVCFRSASNVRWRGRVDHHGSWGGATHRCGATHLQVLCRLISNSNRKPMQPRVHQLASLIRPPEVGACPLKRSSIRTAMRSAPLRLALLALCLMQSAKAGPLRTVHAASLAASLLRACTHDYARLLGIACRRSRDRRVLGDECWAGGVQR